MTLSQDMGNCNCYPVSGKLRRWPKLWRWLAFGSINVQETTGLILQSDLPLHPKKRIRDQRRRCASFARSTPYSDERHSWNSECAKVGSSRTPTQASCLLSQCGSFREEIHRNTPCEFAVRTGLSDKNENETQWIISYVYVYDSTFVTSRIK